MRKILSTFAAALALAGGLARAADEPKVVDPGKLPPAVSAAVQKIMPGAKFDQGLMAAEKGVTRFYLSGVDAKGRDLAVVATATGKVERIESEISLAEVPEPIRKVAAADKNKDKFLRVLGICDDGTGVVTEYGFEGLNEAGEPMVLLSIKPKKEAAAAKAAAPKAATAPAAKAAAPAPRAAAAPKAAVAPKVETKKR